jgi:hypothetical protein
MPDPSAAPGRPSEIRARDRVGALLNWAGEGAGVTRSSLRPCTPERVAEAARTQGVASLAAAHEELLLRAGDGGPGSALEDLFGTDLVGVDDMLGRAEAPPMREVGLELIEALGYGLDEFDVVIRVRPGIEVEYVVTGSPDPPVWAFVAGVDDPILRHPSFTDWLGYRIVRAAKRRHPLCRVQVPAAAPVGGPADRLTG